MTYVPARNTLLLALGLAWAEPLGARDLFMGVNAVDFSGYPDCRRAFLDAFERLAGLATRAGVEGESSARLVASPRGRSSAMASRTSDSSASESSSGVGALIGACVRDGRPHPRRRRRDRTSG